MTEKASKPVRKLGEFGDLRLTSKTKTLDDIQGVSVIINGCDFEDGRFGEFSWLQVTLPDGDNVKVRCGGSLLNKALKEAKEADAFPLEAVIVKRGNAWVVE